MTFADFHKLLQTLFFKAFPTALGIWYKNSVFLNYDTPLRTH